MGSLSGLITIVVLILFASRCVVMSQEDAENRHRAAVDEHHLELAEVRRNLDGKLNDLTLQRARHVASLETAEKENKLLKENVRSLQVVSTS